MRTPHHFVSFHVATHLPCCAADWLENVLQGTGDPKLPKVVVITNPNNPTGTCVPEPLLKVRVIHVTGIRVLWCVFSVMHRSVQSGSHHKSDVDIQGGNMKMICRAYNTIIMEGFCVTILMSAHSLAGKSTLCASCRKAEVFFVLHPHC